MAQETIETRITNKVSAFIKAAKLTTWDQEAHVAFLAYFAKSEAPKDMPKWLLEVGAAKPALLCNASAFRQWLESDKVKLLAKPETAGALGNRYGGLI